MACGFDVSAERDALFMIRTYWDPGWSATVDGRPAPAHAHRSLPAGCRRARRRPRHPTRVPRPTIGRGLLASAIVWIGLLAARVVGDVVERRRRRAGGWPEASPARRRSSASISSSRSPSRTRPTSPISTPVRWSLTIRYGASTYERICDPKSIPSSLAAQVLQLLRLLFAHPLGQSRLEDPHRDRRGSGAAIARSDTRRRSRSAGA